MTEMREPVLIDFSLTTECNADCLYCSVPQWARLHNKERVDMELDLVKSILDNCPGTVILCGRCEPLLYKEIPEVIAHARRRGKWLKTYTNASLLDEDMSQSLLDAGLPLLICSVDECDPERYERIRRGLKFDVMRKNIEGFIRLRNKGGYKTQISVNIIKSVETRDRIEEIRSFWRQTVKVDSVNLIKEETDHATWGPPEPRFYNGSDAHPIKCVRPFDHLTIYPPGLPVLCCVDQCFYPYGDLREEKPLEAFNNETIQEWRRALTAGKNYPTMCHRCCSGTGNAASARPRREIWKKPPGIENTYARDNRSKE